MHKKGSNKLVHPLKKTIFDAHTVSKTKSDDGAISESDLGILIRGDRFVFALSFHNYFRARTKKFCWGCHLDQGLMDSDCGWF